MSKLTLRAARRHARERKARREKAYRAASLRMLDSIETMSPGGLEGLIRKGRAQQNMSDESARHFTGLYGGASRGIFG